MRNNSCNRPSQLIDINNCIDGWFFSDKEINESIEGNRILNPSIDLTNACNLNCPYCYIEEKNSERKVRRPNELSLAETLSIIDVLANYGAKTINIVGSGEPTIDPFFKDIISYIDSKKLKVVVFTNGKMFFSYPRLLKFLYEKNVSIVLKYNSINSKNQDLVVGEKGYSKKRDKVLELLIDFGFNSTRPTRVGIDIIVFKGIIDEITIIHEWCRKNNFFPIEADYIPTGRTEKGFFQGFKAIQNYSTKDKIISNNILQPITKKMKANLINALAKIDAQYGIKYNSQIAYYGGGLCTQILGLYIDISGDIWPCVAKKQFLKDNFVEKKLGNIRNGDLLSTIWGGNIYMENLRRNFSGGCPYKYHLNIEL